MWHNAKKWDVRKAASQPKEAWGYLGKPPEQDPWEKKLGNTGKHCAFIESN